MKEVSQATVKCSILNVGSALVASSEEQSLRIREPKG